VDIQLVMLRCNTVVCVYFAKDILQAAQMGHHPQNGNAGYLPVYCVWHQLRDYLPDSLYAGLTVQLVFGN